jgi:hypothetical protein
MNYLSLALSLFVFNLTSISDCGTNSLFTITEQSFTPEFPEAGDNVSWTISYSVPDNVEISFARSITSGTLNGFIPIEPTEYDLCEEVGCPLVSGEHENTNWLEWPNGIAGSKISLTSIWLDNSDNELLCSKVVVTGQ